MQKMLGRLIGEDIELRVEPRARGRVEADPGQLEQVLLNLAVNGRDAMPAGGALTIETSDADLDEAYVQRHPDVAPGRYVMLEVGDTGVGMDAATQARIFEPFFTTKPEGKGTGLGLATVFGIVKQSRGHIWVDSEPGRGTRFRIYLPRVDAEADRPAPKPQAAPTRRATETILLVEDESAGRELMQEVLSAEGYRVLAAGDDEEALERAAKAGEIHLLVTDVILPRLGGQAVAERLRHERPRLKVLFISGYSAEAVAVTVPPEFELLQKPFTPSQLLRRVGELLDSPG